MGIPDPPMECGKAGRSWLWGELLNCSSVRILAHAHVRVFSRGNERFRAGCKCRAADRLVAFRESEQQVDLLARCRQATKPIATKRLDFEHGPHTFGREISKWYGDVISLVFILLLFVKLNQTINKY